MIVIRSLFTSVIICIIICVVMWAHINSLIWLFYLIILAAFFICFVLNRWFFSFNSFRNFYVDDIDIDKMFQNITKIIFNHNIDWIVVFIYLFKFDYFTFFIFFFQTHDINHETFFWMIFNRIKHSYKNFEFMHTIINKIDIAKKIFTIDLIIASTSKS